MCCLLKRYHIHCLTEEAIFDSDFRSIPPITCPNNSEHKIQIVTESDVFQTNAGDQVVIFQGGTNIKFYKFKCYTIEVSKDIKTEFVFTTCTIVTPRTFLLTPAKENIGDQISFYFYPDTVIGTIINDYKDENTISITLDKEQTIQNGLSLALYDGVNKSIIVNCIGISDNILTLERPLDFNFSSGSQVLKYIPCIENLEIRNINNIEIGGDNLYSSEYPSGLTCKVIYLNRSGTSKIMSFATSSRFGY
jgi:hypothetical protein